MKIGNPTTSRRRRRSSPTVEEVEELNTRLGRGGARDYRLPTGLSVDVTHYRAGLEVFFHGVLHARYRHLRAMSRGICLGLDYHSRSCSCRGWRWSAATTLSEEDMALSYYEGDEIDLTRSSRVRRMSRSPTRPLCRETCRGLCHAAAQT